MSEEQTPPLKVALTGGLGFTPDYSEMSADAVRRHATRLAQMLHDHRPVDFWRKHAIGPMLAPSCLCCGELPQEVAIRHLELPGIVICKRCRDRAVTPNVKVSDAPAFAGQSGCATQEDAK